MFIEKAVNLNEAVHMWRGSEVAAEHIKEVDQGTPEQVVHFNNREKAEDQQKVSTYNCVHLNRSLLQGQMRVAKRKSAYNMLIIEKCCLSLVVLFWWIHLVSGHRCVLGQAGCGCSLFISHKWGLL